LSSGAFGTPWVAAVLAELVGAAGHAGRGDKGLTLHRGIGQHAGVAADPERSRADIGAGVSDPPPPHAASAADRATAAPFMPWVLQFFMDCLRWLTAGAS